MQQTNSETFGPGVILDLQKQLEMTKKNYESTKIEKMDL
jgi:hypothetical protein